MKVSLEWLKEFVPIRLSAGVLSEKLVMGGLEVMATEIKGNDILFEIEITPNRPDLLSHIGIAREIAALTGVRMKALSVTPKRAASFKPGRPPLRISIQDKKGCLRYIGSLFDGVQLGEAPSWMKERLLLLGFRSVNTIVDITNYVLLEEGQPLHAFDYDRLSGGEVRIRSAKKGEVLLAIDGTTRTLEPEDLVIADAKRPIALAGIIGGKETEVGPGTRRVLLESGWFDPVRVRRTAKRLGITTESSYRFERRVWLEGVKRGSEKAGALFEKWANAHPAALPIDIGMKTLSKKQIVISLEQINETLGVSVSLSQSRSFFTQLGCRAVSRGTSLQVTPPSFRQDLLERIDLVEEVGRLFGYDRVPMTTPVLPRLSLGKQKSYAIKPRELEKEAASFLVSQGLFEAMTYSLLSRALLEEFFKAGHSAIPIRNPLSLEQEFLRPSLLPRLVEAVAYNIHRKAEGVPLFELGPVYTKQENHYSEKKHIAMVLSGKSGGNWKAKPALYDYFDLKGRCEGLVKRFAPSASLREEAVTFPFFNPDVSKALVMDEKPVGFLGEIAPSILRHFDLRGKLYAAEIDFGELMKRSSTKHYIPLPKHPSVRRDIALMVDQKTLSETVAKTIREKGGDWVTDVTLFDTYADPRLVPPGFRGIAYRISFQHPDRTLTDGEVNEKFSAILEALKNLGVRIR